MQHICPRPSLALQPFILCHPTQSYRTGRHFWRAMKVRPGNAALLGKVPQPRRTSTFRFLLASRRSCERATTTMRLSVAPLTLALPTPRSNHTCANTLVDLGSCLGNPLRKGNTWTAVVSSSGPPRPRSRPDRHSRKRLFPRMRSPSSTRFRPVVCTENLIRIDCVTESPKRQRR